MRKKIFRSLTIARICGPSTIDSSLFSIVGRVLKKGEKLASLLIWGLLKVTRPPNSTAMNDSNERRKAARFQLIFRVCSGGLKNGRIASRNC